MTEIEYRWIAVRCCCQPTKVLGFLRATAQQLKARSITLPPRTSSFDLEAPGLPMVGLTLERPEVLEILPISNARGVYYESESAIYSEDRPIEFWRSVKGFVEAK